MKELSPDNELYVWLLPFVGQLRGKGLPITPDTHIKLVTILDSVGDKTDDYATLLDYIMPVLAQNTTHIAIIKDEYTRFIELQKLLNPPPPPPLPPVKHWRKYLFIVLGLLAVAGIVYLFAGKKHPPVDAAYQVNTNTRDLSVVFNAMPEYKYYADTQQLTYHWDFGDGTVTKGTALMTHIYPHPGNYETSLTIGANNTKLEIKTPTQKQNIAVCKPQVLIDPGIPSEADSGAELMFTLVYSPEFPPAKENTWSVNGNVVDSNRDTLYYTFTQTGLQTVQFTAHDSNAIQGCNNTADKPVYIKAPREIDIKVVQAGSMLQPPWKRNLAIIFILLGIVAAGMLTYLWLKRFAERKKKEEVKDDDVTEDLKGDGEPYEIPFVSHNERIDDETELYKLAKKYNHRVEDNQYYLNIQQTIAATIQSEGFIRPIYSHRTVPAEYLVLIDKTKIHNQQIRLFEYLVKKLAGNDVHIEQFSFTQGIDRCCNEIYPDGIGLMKLYDLYPTHTIVIFSDGYALLDKYYPAPIDELVSLLKRWKSRIVFTPVPYSSWDHREKAIREVLWILPADLRGQLEFFNLEEGGSIDYEEDIEGIGGDKDLREIDFQNIEGIKQYLGKDVFLLQWLCAIAIYPQIQWDILIAIGDALQRRNYRSCDVNYTALLRLARIPWMQDQFFPPGLRLELLKQLEPVNEKIARETMIEVMREAATKLTVHSFAYEEMYLQQVADKAILFAHDPEDDTYKHYHDSFLALKSLWQKDQLSDQSMVTYLSKDNGKGEWTTLIGNDLLSKDPSKSVAIETLFDEKKKEKPKTWRYAKAAALIVSSLAFLLLAAIFILPKALLGSGLDKSLNIFTADSNGTVPVHIKLAGGDCLTPAQIKKDSIQLSLLISSMPLQLPNSDTTINLPYKFITDAPIQVRITGLAGNFNSSKSVSITNDSLFISASGCRAAEGCSNWKPAKTLTIPLSTTGNWYDEHLLTGEPAICVPLSIESNMISDLKIVQASVCSIDPGFFRYTVNTMTGYKNIYIQNEGSAEISYNEDPAIYRTIDNANSSTYKPLLQRMVNLQITGQDFTGSGTREVLQLGNNWSNSRNGSIVLINDSLRYRNSTWKIALTSTMTTTFKRKIYQLSITNGGINKLLYVLPIDTANIYVSEAPDKDSSTATNVNLDMGTFYRYGKEENIAALPSAINEIWSGTSNNRFFRINLVSNLLWYSTGGSNTFGTYRISKVTGDQSNGFRIIAGSEKGYRVFFARNITANSLELAACDQFINEDDASRMQAGACGSFNAMHLYYEVNRSVIYLPANTNLSIPGSLYIVESAKLQSIVDNITKSDQPGYANYKINTVDFYMAISNAEPYKNALQAYINRSRLNNKISINTRVYTVGVNPFSRPYMVFKAVGQDNGGNNNSNTQQTNIPNSNAATTQGNKTDLGQITFTNGNSPDNNSSRILKKVSSELAYNKKATVVIDVYYYRGMSSAFNNRVNAVAAQIQKETGKKPQINMIKATSSTPGFNEIRDNGVIRISGYNFDNAKSAY